MLLFLRFTFRSGFNSSERFSTAYIETPRPLRALLLRVRWFPARPVPLVPHRLGNWNAGLHVFGWASDGVRRHT